MLHCCPSGTTCNVAAGKCDSSLSSSVSVPWSVKAPAIYNQQESANVVPLSGANGNSEVCVGDDSKRAWCKDGSTCCQARNGNKGCCPFKEVSLLVLRSSLAQ